MTGSEVVHREHYQLEQHCLWWRRYDGGITKGTKETFSICNADHRLIPYHSSSKLAKTSEREAFPELAYSPEASFPQLSISPWCLKRGTAAASPRPSRENSPALRLMEASNCDASDYHPPHDETRAGSTERVNSNTLIYQDAFSVFVCCSIPLPILLPVSYLSICLPRRWNGPKTAAVQSISIFQIY